MDFKPLSDRIIIRPDAEEEITKGGIVLADAAKEKPQRGVILAVGTGKRSQTGDTVPLEVSVGDFVIFNKYAGTEMRDKEDKIYLIMREEDILAIDR